MYDLNYIGNNDCEIGNIYRVEYEYIIEINLWNGKVVRFKTSNCSKITHNINTVDEIGDILVKDGIYQFMTVDDEINNAEIILEIIADNLYQV